MATESAVSIADPPWPDAAIRGLPESIGLPLLLTPEQAAYLIGKSRTEVYSLIRTGQVASVKSGRRRLVSRASCERFVEALLAGHEAQAAS